jgi:hypothetical protein
VQHGNGSVLQVKKLTIDKSAVGAPLKVRLRSLYVLVLPDLPRRCGVDSQPLVHLRRETKQTKTQTGEGAGRVAEASFI